MFKNEKAAMGLPIRMVVLTIIGMAGLAAMMILIADMNLIPKSMHGTIVGIDGSASSSVLYANSGLRTVIIEVIDIDGQPVDGATVVIFGLQSSASGITGRDGMAVISLDTSSFRVKGEGYLKLSARAQGFMDYQNDFALKVVND